MPDLDPETPDPETRFMSRLPAGFGTTTEHYSDRFVAGWDESGNPVALSPGNEEPEASDESPPFTDSELQVIKEFENTVVIAQWGKPPPPIPEVVVRYQRWCAAHKPNQWHDESTGVPMTANPEPLDLEAIKARMAVARPGPWEETFTSFGEAQVWAYRHGEPEANRRIALFDARVDAEFVAHARTDVPALVSEVERLRDVPADVDVATRAIMSGAVMDGFNGPTGITKDEALTYAAVIARWVNGRSG